VQICGRFWKRNESLFGFSRLVFCEILDSYQHEACQCGQLRLNSFTVKVLSVSTGRRVWAEKGTQYCWPIALLLDRHTR